VSSAEKIALAIVTLATVTTLILPGRQTAQVANSVLGGFTSAIKTAMGR
jgi:hypothetical protein